MRARGRAALVALACSAAMLGCSGAQTSTSVDSNRELAKGIPAEIDQNPDGFVSRDVVDPLVNAWRTAGTTTFTQVDAGALTGERSTGALAVFRYDFVDVTQDVDLVKVLGSGSLRITGAPTGEAVEDSAQRDGTIEFLGKTGVRGTLDLRDDSVALRP